MVTHCSYSRDAHFYLLYTFPYNFCKDYTIIDTFAWAYFADKKALVAKEPMRHGLQLKSTRQKLNGRHTAITCHRGSCWGRLQVVSTSLSCTDRYLNSSNSSIDSLEALDWLKSIFKSPPKQHRENQPTTTLFSRGSHPVSHVMGDSWWEPPATGSHSWGSEEPCELCVEGRENVRGAWGCPGSLKPCTQ